MTRERKDTSFEAFGAIYDKFGLYFRLYFRTQAGMDSSRICVYRSLQMIMTLVPHIILHELSQNSIAAIETGKCCKRIMTGHMKDL